MSVCPYCDQPQNALKNHVRLSSGGGHGPSGQYPGDFKASAGGAQAGTDHTSTDSTVQDDQSPSDDGGNRESGNTTDSADREADRTARAEHNLTKRNNDPTVGSGVDSGEFKLPCGHETFDASEVPEDAIEDGKTVVICGTCGEAREVTGLS